MGEFEKLNLLHRNLIACLNLKWCVHPPFLKKSTTHTPRCFPRSENRNLSSKMIRISREKTRIVLRQSREKWNQHSICRIYSRIYMKPRNVWEIIKPLTNEKGDWYMIQATRYLLTNLARKFTALLSNRSTNIIS